MGLSRIILALDGGGSKTDAVALSADGRVLARARAGGSSPQTLGLDTAFARVDALARDVLARAGADAAVRVHAYLSGLDLPDEVDRFRAALAAASWTPREPAALVVDNDMFALLRAGTDEADAVAVVCGTGINAMGVRADGRTVRFRALGQITGDWGGGWQIGEQAVWHAARAADGRGEPTALVDLVPSTFGMASLDDVILALHRGSLRSSALRDLCPVVMRASAAGDAVSQSIVDRQAEEVVTLATTSLRRLDLLDAAVPVVLGGGVIASGDRRLMAGIDRGLAARAPRARIMHVVAPPVVGAALLAVAAAGGQAEALTRVRAALVAPEVVA
jgi:N-acetylglucosamine kinase-like BadF-type ATPase